MRCARAISVLNSSVVRDEIVALPVAFKYGGKLREYVWVACRRGPNVPLKARHLSRVGQVGRADEGRRVPVGRWNSQALACNRVDVRS